MHYLFYQAIETARHFRMTDAQREEQLISRVYGNIHLEQPAVTKEMVRELVRNRPRKRSGDAAIPG